LKRFLARYSDVDEIDGEGYGTVVFFLISALISSVNHTRTLISLFHELPCFNELLVESLYFIFIFSKYIVAHVLEDQ